MSADTKTVTIPKTFVWRRLHSLMGLWFSIFLIEHMFTNSQVALFFGGNELWFVRFVDFLRNIPYLHFVEVGLLGIPIAYHAAWGIYYMISSKPNSMRGNGTRPVMKYARSRAYTWQRITAWILLFGIVLHVVQMRFIAYPYKYRWAGETKFYVKLSVDPGLYSVADKLDVKLYDTKAIEREKESYTRIKSKIHLVEDRKKELLQQMREEKSQENYSSELDSVYQSLQNFGLMRENLRGLESREIKEGQVMAVSKSFGALELLNVRETFQSLIMCFLYTVFVLAAVFHAFNGVWTFLITWGLILSRRSHSTGKTFSLGLMFLIGLFGMMAIWGTFFLSL